MKLLNQSIKHLSLSILGIVTIWSIVFYINMVREIKSSIDEGLENYKRLIIQNAHQDSSILNKNYFDESFFTVEKIDKETALAMKDQYIDTSLYMQDFDDLEPELEEVRMLITAFEFNGTYYELKVANSMVDREDMIRAFFLNTIWLYIALIIGIILINNVVLKRLWNPFYSLLHQLKSYRLGRTQHLPEIHTKTREFSDLQDAINILLTDSKNTFEQQKIFIGNASHELQTPLAIASNKIELLLEDKNLANQQAEDLTEVYQIIQRMVRLNKSLLLLSKIENKQFIENQVVSIPEVIQQAIEELEDFAAYKNIDLKLNIDNELSVTINPSLAHIIVSNLLKNAIFHNFENGSVVIDVQSDRLRISNSGEKQALDSKKIFTQFYKSNNSVQGTGLGLAIVKAITNLYGYSMDYHFLKQMHCIEIHFQTKVSPEQLHLD